MCECEESCCTSQAQTEEGCPVDIVIAIDMCSCNNDTWHDMKGKSQILNVISLYLATLTWVTDVSDTKCRLQCWWQFWSGTRFFHMYLAPKSRSLSQAF